MFWLQIGLVCCIMAGVNLIVLGKPELCPCRMLLGIPCPACGLTHSVIAFLHGDISGSIIYHPFMLPLIASLAAGIACQSHIVRFSPLLFRKTVLFLGGNRLWHAVIFWGMGIWYLLRLILYFPNGPYPMEYSHFNYMELTFTLVRHLFHFCQKAIT